MEMYNSPTWQDKVRRMPDRQIFCIYNEAKKSGKRLDENIRKMLLKTTSNPTEREYIKRAPAWKVFDMYNEYTANVIAPSPVYHQMTLFELGVKNG